MILSPRARHVMTVLGAESVADLARHSEDEIAIVRNCGEATIREIRDALQSIGLDLRRPSRDVPEYSPEAPIIGVADLDESCGTASLSIRRLAVPGGWLYVAQVSRQSQCAEHGTDCREVLSAIPTFVPDA